MSENKSVKIGMIGAGSIASFIHLPAYEICPQAEVAVICDAYEEAARKTADRWGIARVETDYKKVLADPEIDGVVIATPNYLHHPITMEAIAAGKHVLCEKPLGLSADQVKEMAMAARRAGVVNVPSFVYRQVPAMRQLKSLVSEGYLGEIRHIRAFYLQMVPEIWLGWRSESKFAGTGTLGDVGSHLIDFGRYLAGEIGAVTGSYTTFLHQRQVPGTQQFKESDVDDSAAFIAEFDSGATGVFEVTRLAPGRGCSRLDYQSVEINGSKGSAVYYLQDPFNLQVCLLGPFDEMHMVMAPVPEKFWVVPGSPRKRLDHEDVVGFRYDQAYSFVQAIRGEAPPSLPSFVDGYRCQEVLDAVVEAADTRRWVDVKYSEEVG